MGLGITTNMAQGARAAGAPPSTAWGPAAARWSNRIPDDDRAVAVIQNLHRAENSGVGHGAMDGSPAETLLQRMRQFIASFRDNLTRYKKMSEEVADGRFSPKTLRDRIEQMEEAMGMAGGDLPGGQNFGGGQRAIDGSPTGTRRHRLQQLGGPSSESLLRYKELSEQVADGSWSPKALRERLKQMSEAADLPSGQNSRIAQGAIDGRPAATLFQRLQQFGASSSESLIRYKELSEKVAGGRWSPKALRDQIEASKKIGDNSDTATRHTPPPAFLASDDSKSASKGSTDTHALSWLKDQAQQALSSQKDIEPDRVLALL